MPFIITVCISVCAVLLLLELLLRYRGQEKAPFVPADVLRLREETRVLNQESVAHSIRVVAFGDSIPYGWGLSGAESYPAILKGMLDESHSEREVAVINAGIPGNTVVLGWQRLRRDVLRWKPHVVLIGFGLNDVNLARSIYDERRERALQGRLTPIGRLKAALRSSVLWSTVVDTLKGRPRGGGVSVEVDEVPKALLPRTSRNVFELAVRDMVQRIRRRKARAVLLTMTPVSRRFLGQAGGGGQLSELITHYNAIIRREAERSGSLLIDVHGCMSSRPDVESFIGWDGVHLNAEGQEVLAQIIHDALAESAVLRYSSVVAPKW